MRLPVHPLSPGLAETQKALLSCPSTTTFERFPASSLIRLLKQRRISYSIDPYGNIHAGDLKSESPLIFVAHLDHPGISLTASGNSLETACWWGGVRKEYFRHARVRVYPYDENEAARSGSQAVEGTVRALDIPKGSLRPRAVTIRFDEPLESGRSYIGNWATTELKITSQWIESVRIDDLAGVGCIVETLSRLNRRRRVRALFSRAEEDGFHGSLAAAREIPPGSLMVSVECSATRPGAIPGNGPVVRQGDAATVFDPLLTRLLDEIATNLKQTHPAFAFQKRIMDGGTCEATAFLALGFRAVGLALPLLHYHNMGPKGLIAAEKVATSDVENLVLLMCEVAERWQQGKRSTLLVKRLKEKVKTSARLLRSMPLPDR